MIAVLAWIPILILLVVIQKTILDIFTFHHLTIDLLLLFVIYAGFSMSVLRGGVLSLLAGFLVSSLTGTASSLFMLVYITIYSLAYLVSARVYIEQPLFIMTFTFVCSLLEAAMLVLIGYFFLAAPAVLPLLQAVLPPVLILSLISPLFFKGFRKFEVIIHAQTVQPR